MRTRRDPPQRYISRKWRGAAEVGDSEGKGSLSDVLPYRGSLITSARVVQRSRGQTLSLKVPGAFSVYPVAALMI